MDPNSPAGIEYAVPLYHGRSIGAPSGGGTRRDPGRSPPLFGGGVRHTAQPVVKAQPTLAPQPGRPTRSRPAPRRTEPATPVGPGLASVGGPSPGLVAGGAAAGIVIAALLAVGLVQFRPGRRRR